MSKELDFYGWLMNQSDRDDPVGDLANDAKSDSNAKNLASNKEAWLDHLSSIGASSAAIFTFEEAWLEFRGGKS